VTRAAGRALWWEGQACRYIHVPKPLAGTEGLKLRRHLHVARVEYLQAAAHCQAEAVQRVGDGGILHRHIGIVFGMAQAYLHAVGLRCQCRVPEERTGVDSVCHHGLAQRRATGVHRDLQKLKSRRACPVAAERRNELRLCWQRQDEPQQRQEKRTSNPEGRHRIGGK
jgi:hypothetical protein